MKREYTPEQKERKRLYDIEYNKINKTKRAEQLNKWTNENKDKKKLTDKLWYENNKEKKKEYDKNYINKTITNKKYYEANKETLKEKNKIYSQNNKEQTNLRIQNRKQNDNLFKLKCDLRSLIKESFKRNGNKKITKTEIILGCSFDFFKEYIESKFESWMNWENKGNPKDGIYELNKTWDIDHIIPLDSAKTIEDIIKLNHYSNLQPLCSYTNRFIKNSKF